MLGVAAHPHHTPTLPKRLRPGHNAQALASAWARRSPAGDFGVILACTLRLPRNRQEETNGPPFVW